jgi:alpha-beta hydrolase superfamily lysophospholipase
MIKYTIPVLFILTLNLPAQHYQIGKTKITLTDTARRNRKVVVSVFYPALNGDDSLNPDNDSDLKFPVVCFSHGFVLSTGNYKNIWEMLVPEGFIVVLPETEKGFLPSHKSQAIDIGFVLEQFTGIGKEDSTSIFFNRIDTMLCVMGHSMGGGSSFVAARIYSFIDAIVTLAPYNPKPAAIEAASEIGIPSLIFSGSNDRITRPVKHQLPMYESLKSSDKTYIIIKGGSHCQMADTHSLCRLAELMKFSCPQIRKPEQHEILARYIVPWLKFFLRKEKEAGVLFDSILLSDNDVECKQSKTLSSK